MGSWPGPVASAVHASDARRVPWSRMTEQRAYLPGRWLNRPASSRRVAVIIGVVVTFLWATSVVLIRIGVSDEDIEPIGFAATRFLLAAMLLLPLALPGIRAAPTWQGSRRWLTGVAVYGLLLFCVAQVGFYLALGALEASTVGLLMGLAPVVTALVAVRSRHERASALAWSCTTRRKAASSPSPSSTRVGSGTPPRCWRTGAC
jgi:hypothetical protein